MNEVTIETANYIIAHYSILMNLHELKALKHYRSTVKIDPQNEQATNVYLKIGWLSNDPHILNYLKDGYVQFILSCAERILKENPGEVLFNLCPVCDKLARTPQAKQCRFCGHDWH